MTSRERVMRALNFQPTDRVPRDLWKLYGVLLTRKPELDEMTRRFDFDFTFPTLEFGQSERASGNYCEVGEYVDAWGCRWTVAERGVCGEVKNPPLADWSALAHYRPPLEVLDNADFSEVNRSCAATTKFVKVGTDRGPFERLQALRGVEAAYLDLGYGSKEVGAVLRMVHDFLCRELRMLANTDVDGVLFGDDWGAQGALLIAPEMWRDIFKPLYREYCSLLREKGKYAIFHSDGFIEPIFPDLIEIGVHAVNSQLFCMDIEKLGRLYSGKVTFYGEMDRQHILPFGTVEEVRAAVRRVRKALDHGKGGVIAECCWGLRDPFENIAAVYEEWEKPWYPQEAPVSSVAG